MKCLCMLYEQNYDNNSNISKQQAQQHSNTAQQPATQKLRRLPERTCCKTVVVLRGESQRVFHGSNY